MDRISLSDFITVVSLTGIPKVTKIKEIKNRGPYTPAADFYRPLKQQIVDTHLNGLPKSNVAAVMGTLTDAKKITNYPHAVKGYTKWWGNKKFTCHTAPRAVFTGTILEVVINPDVCLEFNGKRHVVKLYFKDAVLRRDSMQMITQLMHHCLSAQCLNNEIMCVLDVRRNKLFEFVTPNPVILAMLKAELTYIENVWLTV